MSAPTVRLVVTVGTDHHRFDRLTGWLEDWLAAHPEVECVHQHGSSRPVEGAVHHRILPRPQMLGLQREADVVVAQGGPGSITDARASGRVPIVVPRQARLGEVVDDHQVAFSRHLARRGWIRLAETAEELTACLDAAVADPASLHIEPVVPSAQEAARELARVLDDVRRRPLRRLDRSRLRHTMGSLLR